MLRWIVVALQLVVVVVVGKMKNKRQLLDLNTIREPKLISQIRNRSPFLLV